MADKSSDRVIPRRELLAYRAAFKHQIFRQIRKVFNALKGREGFSQKALAIALGIDEGLLSRRLSGKHDMRLETFADLARGLECKLDVRLIPIEEVKRLALLEQQRISNMKAAPSAYYWSGIGGRTANQNVEPIAKSNNEIRIVSAVAATHE